MRERRAFLMTVADGRVQLCSDDVLIVEGSGERAYLATEQPSAVGTPPRQRPSREFSQSFASGPWHYGRSQKSGTGRKVIQLQCDQANIVGEIVSAGKLLNFLDELPT